MKLKDKLRRDKEQLERLPDRNSRIAFVWDYYKIPIIAVMSVFAVLLIMFVSSIGRKDASMYAVLLNSDSAFVECDDAVFDRVLEKSGLDLKKKTVDVNDKLTLGYEGNESADIETLNVLSALFTISDLDLYIADQEWFDYFAKGGGYCDLGMLIDKDVLNRHEKDLHYCEDVNGNKILAGIVLHPGSPIHEAGYYHDDVIMGVASRAVNMDVAVEFIRTLLSQ